MYSTIYIIKNNLSFYSWSHFSVYYLKLLYLLLAQVKVKGYILNQDQDLNKKETYLDLCNFLR